MRGAIASPQASATEAGLAAYRDGGNALDAALAAALALLVSYPSNCVPGGDLIALVHTDGTAVEVNASGPAAAGTDPGEVRRRHGGMPVYGPDTVTVPGLLAGLHAIHARGARRSWSAAFDAAIVQAEDGVAVAPTLAADLALDAERLARDPGWRATLFGDDGRPLPAGATLRQPALARSLRLLADRGPSAFYAGELGASAVRRLRSLGSALDVEDLLRFEPEMGEPLRAGWDDGELLTSRPNTQGFLLALILGALDEAPDPLGPQAGVLARLAAAAARDRERHLGDPRRVEVPLDALLDPERLAAIGREAARGEPVPRTPGGSVRGDTVAVVAADDAGNAVCLIQSAFHSFGAGIQDPATGIGFHNRGASFSLDPASPNVLAPGTRPAHTLMPAMLLRDGRPSVVLGTMGGKGQPQILAHVLLHLARGAGAQEALDAPRWLVGGMGADAAMDEVRMERDVPTAAQRALLDSGIPVRELPAHDQGTGHAQLVAIGPDRALEAASDPRSEGRAATA